MKRMKVWQLLAIVTSCLAPSQNTFHPFLNFMYDFGKNIRHELDNHGGNHDMENNDGELSSRFL